MITKASPVLSHLALASLLALLALYAFHNSMAGDFTFDDRYAILENQDMKPTANWSGILQHDFWGQSLASNSSHKSFRPLTTATFKLNYHLYERTTWSYHAVNVSLHAMATVLVYFLACRIFPNSKIFGGKNTQNTKPKIPFQIRKNPI